jgi:hypothetical protein
VSPDKAQNIYGEQKKNINDVLKIRGKDIFLKDQALVNMKGVMNKRELPIANNLKGVFTKTNKWIVIQTSVNRIGYVAGYFLNLLSIMILSTFYLSIPGRNQKLAVENEMTHQSILK